MSPSAIHFSWPGSSFLPSFYLLSCFCVSTLIVSPSSVTVHSLSKSNRHWWMLITLPVVPSKPPHSQLAQPRFSLYSLWINEMLSLLLPFSLFIMHHPHLSRLQSATVLIAYDIKNNSHVKICCISNLCAFCLHVMKNSVQKPYVWSFSSFQCKVQNELWLVSTLLFIKCRKLNLLPSRRQLKYSNINFFAGDRPFNYLAVDGVLLHEEIS